MEIPMSRFTGFSEKSFFLKKNWNMGEVAVGCDAMAVNFLKESDSTDCSMRVLERLDFQSDVM